ncbi:MAG: cyclic pyranopterin monophosphate synthase MoaC [Nitrospinota bacterium]|nr:MAG: cyclic pyranopterin monophosphate synthase MoaC [Nitrospinota bacterium]
MEELTHFDQEGKVRMVDVSDKPVTQREAVARGSISMQAQTLQKIQQMEMAKGDVLGVAKLAGIMAAKRTWELIPLCHPLPIGVVELSFSPRPEQNRIDIESRVQVAGKTGVEMEALTAVAVAALTIYDMCKAVDRTMCIGDIRLVKKSGGRSGTFLRPGEEG